jgi:hypothetical protein
MLFVGQLPAQDRRALRRLVRHGAPHLSFRARVLVLSADGFSVPALSRMLGCCRRTVRGWIHAYHSCGLAGVIGCLRGWPSKEEEEEEASVFPPRQLLRGPSGPPGWCRPLLSRYRRSAVCSPVWHFFLQRRGNSCCIGRRFGAISKHWRWRATTSSGERARQCSNKCDCSTRVCLMNQEAGSARRRYR